jgi:iron complex transport system substrate-binding protein
LRAFLWEECPFLFLLRRSFQLALIFVVAACADSGTRSRFATDDFGDEIKIGTPPRRIVSLNPATTEMLFALGVGNRLVGRSKYDLWPDSATLVPSVGDGIRPNVEAVLGQKPDLVILYASQDNRPAATRLRAAGVNTLSLKRDRVSDFRGNMMLLGAVTGDTAKARTIVDSVYHTIDSVRAVTSHLARPSVFWHIWDAPVVTIGAGSFMADLVDIAGGRNVYADIPQSSAEVSLEDVARRNPDVILAGPLGKTQIESDARWRIVRAARDRKIMVVDTGVVARPSVRLGEAAVAIARLLHPGALR